ncbi:rhombosortase [Ferrimonas senticii]|uniref:rhombosortase n=1 Tax=Ferrimonas senticii TaxID=394566 RepID=UPI0006848243|nr:rhombosortase [Ferrimonas senticii]
MPSLNASKPTEHYGKPTAAQLALPLLLSISAISLALLPELHDSLDWYRTAISHGEHWRLLSGHLLHSNWPHLLMNLGGLWLLLALFQPYFNRVLAIATPVMMLLIAAAMLLTDSERYVGLSALLHGLFVWGALEDLRYRRRSGYLLLMGIIAKVLWENLMGADSDIAALINARVAVESHLIGALAGALCWGAWRMAIRRRANRFS